VVGLYATLTHAQPFFTYIHALLFVFLSPLGLATLTFPDASTKLGGSQDQLVVAPLDVRTARAVCAVVLCTLHISRAMRLYGPDFGETITRVVAATSKSEPSPEPSTEEGEKIDKSADEEIVETRRRGRVETATSTKGQSDDSISVPGADHILKMCPRRAERRDRVSVDDTLLDLFSLPYSVPSDRIALYDVDISTNRGPRLRFW
jgi:hypothetical protein